MQIWRVFGVLFCWLPAGCGGTALHRDSSTAPPTIVLPSLCSSECRLRDTCILKAWCP